MNERCEFSIVIPSRTASIRPVRVRTLALMEAADFSERDRFCVRLALEEALVNAIRHGNGSDPHKVVRIDCVIQNGIVLLEVEDEGQGFDPNSVPDPTTHERLCEPDGRGIHVMRHFMDVVMYAGGGRRVVMQKQQSRQEARIE